EAAQREAEETKLAYQQKLSSAREEASRIREDAKAQAAAQAADIRAQASSDADRMVTQAKAAIEADRAMAKTQLKAEIGSMATGLAGKIVGESLSDDARAQRTVDRFLEELEQA
ncbi:MAG: F0F1 ATP synthase subunit B, partial [Propionibacteriaceae bacterium]